MLRARVWTAPLLLLRLLELLPLLRLVDLLLLLELLLRLLELLLFSPPPRRSCASSVGTVSVEGISEVASTSMPSLLNLGCVFMPSPYAPTNPGTGADETEGLPIVGQYTPGHLTGGLRRAG